MGFASTYDRSRMVLINTQNDSYQSGRVAVCISKVNSYQKRYYAYEGIYDDRPSTWEVRLRQQITGSVPFCALWMNMWYVIWERVNVYDEAVVQVGSAGRREGKRLILTRDGGIVSDCSGDMLKVHNHTNMSFGRF